MIVRVKKKVSKLELVMYLGGRKSSLDNKVGIELEDQNEVQR